MTSDRFQYVNEIYFANKNRTQCRNAVQTIQAAIRDPNSKLSKNINKKLIEELDREQFLPDPFPQTVNKRQYISYIIIVLIEREMKLLQHSITIFLSMSLSQV